VIDDICTHLNSLANTSVIERIQKTLIVEIKIDQKTYLVEVNLGDNFPVKLPQIKLLEAASYGFLAHVCWKGIICYSDGEGLSIDLSDPAAVAEYALDEARKILSIDKKDSDIQFYDEFEGYWGQQGSSSVAYTFIEPTERVCLIEVYINKSKNPIAFFPREPIPELDKEYRHAINCKAKKTRLNSAYLPLSRAIAPPLPGIAIGIGYLNLIIDSLSEENESSWSKLIKSKLPNDLYLLISQPRPNGERAMFGLVLPKGKNWINGKIESYSFQLTPLSVIRHTPEYLTTRAGGNTDLKEKHITIVGCGAVGCRIAELLITSGVRKLTLIDYDVFSTDNLFRHTLDSGFIGQNKAVALAAQFRQHFPYIQVESISEELFTLPDYLDNTDAVVVAIGSPTVERIFNQQNYNHGTNNKQLMLTTWLEALGLGGHAILSDGQSKGCLHCLYHRDNSEQLSSITNYIAENQNVTKNLTGCGGAFTPFSAIDAAKTAEMATRLLISALTLEEKPLTLGCRYQYWKGMDDAAKNSRIHTTSWYEVCDLAEQKDDISSHLANGCPVCR
jgi:molybdopterin/thiamine biosynthesis adenylyltransferase